MLTPVPSTHSMSVTVIADVVFLFLKPARTFKALRNLSAAWPTTNHIEESTDYDLANTLPHCQYLQKIEAWHQVK